MIKEKSYSKVYECGCVTRFEFGEVNNVWRWIVLKRYLCRKCVTLRLECFKK